jgi:hypothetical protein
MRRLLSTLALAFASLSAASTAHAGHFVDVSVIDRDSGQVSTTYAHDGQYWIAGTPGHRYAVRLRNNTGERVLAVLSVDGVNAVSGETASAQQAGYVLGPWQETEVAGWRKSLNDIAQFEFTALSNSYAARTGRPNNVGVIGVAVFRERQPVYRRHDEISKQESLAPSAAAERESRQASADALGSSGTEAKMRGPAAPMPQESLGTGHGAREWSVARQVEFQRDSRHPVQVSTLRYDSHRNLVAMGVIARPHRPRYAPDPFPIGFVPDPAPRWR